MKKALFVVLITLLAAIPYSQAEERYYANLGNDEYIDFDNSFGGGVCLAMTHLMKAVQTGALTFDPHKPPMSDIQIYRALETAICAERPTTIRGLSSLEALSQDYEDILKVFLIDYNFKLNLQALPECTILFWSDHIRKPATSESKARKNKILKKIKIGEPVILGIDGVYDDSDLVNHSILVEGATVFNDDKIDFHVHDPNKPNKKTLRYRNGGFYYKLFDPNVNRKRYVLTSTFITNVKYKKFEKMHQYHQKQQKFRKKLGTRSALHHGKIEDQGQYIGKKTRHSLYSGKDAIHQVESKKYNLGKHKYKDIVMLGDLSWERSPRLPAISDLPVFEVKELYEVKRKKNMRAILNAASTYLAVGKLEDRGVFIGRKGAFEIKLDGKTKYVLKSKDPKKLKKLLGQTIGIQGKVVGKENGIDVIEVSEINDFNEEILVKIPKDY